jgi:hypothetical protein
MGSLEMFFLAVILVGVFVGFLMFARHRSEPSEPESAGEEDGTNHLHRGINIASVAGESLSGLPGLLMTIAFVFIFFGIFLPRDNQWFLVLFIAVEIAAAILYLVITRRNQRDAERVRRALHQINEKQDR